MKRTAIILLLLMLFFSMFLFKNVYSQNINLRVHVDLVITHADGTLNTSAIDGALVKVVHLPSGRTYSGFTENGWALFNVYETGQYNLTIQFMDYLHVPKTFTITDIYTLTTIYDNIYKLAVFFAGDQLTIFQTIHVELPAVIVFKVPKYTNFTSHVDAYGGLKFDLGKLEDRIIFRPYDLTRPFYTETGAIFFPNYTVTITFKVLELGSIGISVGSNMTNILVADPLYTVPQDAWVNIKFIVYVFERPELRELSKIEVILDQLLSLVLQIREILNNTVIPLLGKIYSKLNDTFNYVAGKFEQLNFNSLYEKAKEIDYNVKMVRDTLNMFTAEFKQNLRNVFTEQIGDIRTLAYLFGGLAIVSAVIIGFGKRKTGGSKHEMESYVVFK